MKRFLIKLVSLVLVIASVLSVSACNRKYDEEEVRAAAILLIPKSEILNEIYWGEGIAYIPNLQTSNGAYHEADYISLEKYGFRTIEELKNLTREVFSEAYCQNIFDSSFSSVSDEDEVRHLARYYQKFADKDGLEPEAIMVYSYFEVMLLDKVEYHLDSLVVTHSKKDKVYVSLDVTVTNPDGLSQKRKKTIELIEEADGWRIDSATYITYNPHLDEYENLDKK